MKNKITSFLTLYFFTIIWNPDGSETNLSTVLSLFEVAV